MKYPGLYRKTMIFCIAIFIIVSLSYAQDEARIYQTNNHYEEGDWLSFSEHRFINSIAIGNELVYFATNNGIIRYNYFSNKWDFPWTMSNGIADNTIFVVAFDENTNFVWCSTPQGISYYQPGQKIWTNIYKDEISVSAFGVVQSIGIDANNVWLIAYNGQAFIGDNQMGMFRPTNEMSDQMKNIQWFGKRGWRRTQLTPLFMSDGYLFDSRGFIQGTELREYRISYYLPDRWGMMWFGTEGLGVARADIRTDRMELMPYGFMQQNVTAIAKDDGNFWIGGWDDNYEDHNYGEQSGITHWDMERNKWTYYQAKYITGFDNNQITSVAVDADTVWFGTEQGLVQFISSENFWRTIDQTERIRNNYIYDVVVGEHYVWVATPSGIDRLSKFGGNIDSLKVTWIARDDLREIDVYDLELMDNVLWAGTEYGAYYYDTVTDSGGFLETGLLGPGTKPVYSVACGGNDVWFGTDDEIEIFDLKKQKWCSGPKRKTRIDFKINYIRANEQAAWVGTDEGVWKFDRIRNYWRLFTTADGLIHNKIQTILIDGDYIWFGTPRGLTKFYWNTPFRID